MANKKSKSKVNKKYSGNVFGMILLIIVAAVLIHIIYTIIKLIIVPTNICIIENGIISKEETNIGYVIRDEQVVKGNNYESGIVQIKAEGEKTAKGEQIFRYSSTNEQELNDKIDEINRKIQEAIQGQNDFFSSDVKAIDNQIEKKIDGLKTKNDIQEISEYKKDIDTYITKKSEIAGQTSKAGSYINSLLEEREQYQTQLKSASEYVEAPMSGAVSYRVDNLENVLTPDDFDKINKQFLEELSIGHGQIVTTSSQMGKIVNNYECYIATITKSKEAKESKVNQNVTLRLSTQDEIDATISYISKQDDGSMLIIFKIRNCVEKLIDYRKISFDIIWWKYEGLKAPKSAISYNNGLSYVVRNRGGYYNKILVKILKETDNYCIITNYDADELKNLGFSSEEITNMRKISVYDEIVINPDIENIE